MDFKTLILKEEDSIATLTLNRPESLNAISRQVFDELIDAMDVISKNNKLRALVITGAGRAFSAGGDRSDHPLKSWGGSAQTVSEILHRIYQGIILKLFNLEIPTIAMINGVCVGWALDLALACDLRTGSENTRFMCAFTKVGLTPAAGGAWLLPRVVGMSKAMEVFLTADFIEAKEAERLGIINRLFPAAVLEKETMALAKRFAKNSALGNRLTKLQVHKGQDMDLAAALELGATCQSLCQTSEFTMGVFNAFGDKKA